jgi:protein-disulfide isomerase/uncharacterized membrane protein
MSRLVPLLLALAPSTAFAADGGGASALIGGMVALVVVCAALVAVKPRVGAVASAVGGIAVAGWLVAQHHAAMSGAASMCNISDAWNCDVVNTSQWSEVANVPIALVGVGFYAAMLFLAVRYAMGASPRAPGVMVVLSAAAVATDLFLGLEMVRMRTGCVLCVTTYGLNLALLVASLRLAKEMDVGIGKAFGEALGRDGVNAAIVGLAVIVLGGMAFRGDEGVETAVDGGGGALPTYHLAPALELDGTEPVVGDRNAPYTLVEWADFQCPYCAIMAKELKELLAANKDVKLVYKNYPISEICNRFVEGERHADSCNAAAAARCADKQGRFWELSGKMFGNQEYLGKEDIRFIARDLGLDMTAFEACMGDPTIAEAVKRDVEHGAKAGVEGTPSIFLKGPWGDTWVRVEGDADSIANLLAAARKGEPLPAPQPATAQH